MSKVSCLLGPATNVGGRYEYDSYQLPRFHQVQIRGCYEHSHSRIAGSLAREEHVTVRHLVDVGRFEDMTIAGP